MFSNKPSQKELAMNDDRINLSNMMDISGMSDEQIEDTLHRILMTYPTAKVLMRAEYQWRHTYKEPVQTNGYEGLYKAFIVCQYHSIDTSNMSNVKVIQTALKYVEQNKDQYVYAVPGEHLDKYIDLDMARFICIMNHNSIKDWSNQKILNQAESFYQLQYFLKKIRAETDYIESHPVQTYTPVQQPLTRQEAYDICNRHHMDVNNMHDDYLFGNAYRIINSEDDGSGYNYYY